MTKSLSQQIKDWERCNILLNEIVKDRGQNEDDKWKMYLECIHDYHKEYKIRFNPTEKP